MRILVSGGGGCLGVSAVERWLQAGHDLLVLDNFVTGNRAALPVHSRLDVIEGTIANRDFVESATARFRPTHIVHAAASYNNPLDWREDVATNTIGTINLVEAARAAGVRRFVNLQTVLCYGRTQRVPIPIDHPLQPITSYGISKVAGEQYLAASGLPWASLRIANVVGPRLAIGPIPTFYSRLKAGKKCFCSDAVRDFLDISDFLAAADVALHEENVNGFFHISSGEGRSIREVYDLVRGHLGLGPDPDVQVVPVAEDDVRAVVPDPSETQLRLGWRANVQFSEMMRRVLGWYDSHGVGTIHTHLVQRG